MCESVFSWHLRIAASEIAQRFDIKDCFSSCNGSSFDRIRDTLKSDRPERYRMVFWGSEVIIEREKAKAGNLLRQ